MILSPAIISPVPLWICLNLEALLRIKRIIVTWISSSTLSSGLLISNLPDVTFLELFMNAPSALLFYYPNH